MVEKEPLWEQRIVFLIPSLEMSLLQLFPALYVPDFPTVAFRSPVLTSAEGVFKHLIWSIVTVDLQFCSVFSQIHIQVASSKSKKLVPKESNLFIPDAH